MITIRARNGAIGVCLLLLIGGCSREQQDWRSAEAADTVESYDQFIQRHPESELTTQARSRVSQLEEERDWQRAGSADTADAYRQFLADHPNGKWAQEARIRIENFSLGEQASAEALSRAGTVPPAGAAAPSGAASGGAGTAEQGPAAAGGAAPAVKPAAAAKAVKPAPAALAMKPAATASTSSPPAGPATPAQSGPVTSPVGRVYGVQLGAFSSEAAADSQWRALTARFGPELGGLQEHVVPANTASGRVYRLQATVGDEGRARAICDSLRKRSQACVAVLPH